MKSIAYLVFILFFGILCSFNLPKGGHYKGGKTKSDSVSAPASRKSVFKNKHEPTTSPIISKMSDEQLMLLVDHMFEASYMPPDLWGQVMMETAKRNLSKINRKEFDVDVTCSKEAGTLHIEKLRAEPVEPASDANLMFRHPAANYYGELDEDISNLFKDEFTQDATYTLDIENTEYGCYKMPAWGPLSSPFGWRHNRYHKGVDIQLRKGDPVSCAFDGIVRVAKKQGGYGNVVIVRHYNGLETVYAHLSKIKVQDGDVIGAGDLIGLAGSTGHSTGPHLHFEVRFMGAPVDPQYFISFDYGNLMYNTVEFKKNKSGLLAAFHPDTEFHTVVKGETLIDIATHYATTTKKLRELNGITPKKYFRLKQGMVLKVREIPIEESASK